MLNATEMVNFILCDFCLNLKKKKKTHQHSRAPIWHQVPADASLHYQLPLGGSEGQLGVHLSVDELTQKAEAMARPLGNRVRI